MVTPEQMARYERWEQQDRRVRIVGKIALVFGVLMIALVVIDAAQKMMG